jgi:hypothetical protein
MESQRETARATPASPSYEARVSRGDLNDRQVASKQLQMTTLTALVNNSKCYSCIGHQHLWYWR